MTIEFTVNAKDLGRAIKFVQPAISKEPNRVHLHGIYFEKTAEDDLVLVASDGYRLHKISMKIEMKEEDKVEFNFILSEQSVNILYMLVNKALKYSNIKILYKKEKKELEILNMKLELIDAQFPDYRRIIPTKLEPAKLDHYKTSYLHQAIGNFMNLDKSAALQFLQSQSRDEFSPLILTSPKSGRSLMNAMAIIMPIQVRA